MTRYAFFFRPAATTFVFYFDYVYSPTCAAGNFSGWMRYTDFYI